MGEPPPERCVPEKSKMAKKQTTYLVYNRTDAILADPRSMSRQEAEEFIRLFPKRFEQQGYYKTARGLRIPPEEVELEVIREDTEPE
jgi:hypothetical protein